jgi:DNA-binding GntR family transcriptional regulator
MQLQRPVPTLPELVYGHLRDRILEGTYAAGAPLRQEEIARALDVSRVPVREALTRLESEGLVVLRPRRGYMVVALTAEDILDIGDICERLEALAATEATRRRTPADVAALEAILAEMERLGALARAGDHAALGAWVAQHRAFHATLFAASGRKSLCRLLSQTRDQLEPYIRIELALSDYLAEAPAEHRRILDLFRLGAAEGVGHAAAEHIRKSCQRLLQLAASSTGR